MDVKFISTTAARLPELPIVNGQLIYLSDATGAFYDIGGSRLLISGVKLVSELPQTGQDNVLYCVLNASGFIDSYLWDSSESEYKMLSGYAATVDHLGLVKPDGTTITIDSNGVISCHAAVTSLPASSITYDNTISGLSSTNAQLAFDEINEVAAGAATAIAAQSTAIADLSQRLAAVEAVAERALVIEDPVEE